MNLVRAGGVLSKLSGLAAAERVKQPEEYLWEEADNKQECDCTDPREQYLVPIALFPFQNLNRAIHKPAEHTFSQLSRAMQAVRSKRDERKPQQHSPESCVIFIAATASYAAIPFAIKCLSERPGLIQPGLACSLSFRFSV